MSDSQEGESGDVVMEEEPAKQVRGNKRRKS